jgi:tetratricopeptide (TPR) repeat protein
MRPGWIFAALSILWLAFTSHSAFAQWHRALGRHYLGQTEVSRNDGLSGVFRTKSLSDRHAKAAAEAFRHFDLADRWGLADVVDVKMGLAWGYILRRDLQSAEREAREALDLSPDDVDLKQNLEDIRRASSAETRHALAVLLAEAGKLDEAAVEFQAAVASTPNSYEAALQLGRRAPAARSQRGGNRAAARGPGSVPGRPEVYVELGLASMAEGAKADAVDAFQRAIALAPDSAESRVHLPELIRQLTSATEPSGR